MRLLILIALLLLAGCQGEQLSVTTDTEDRDTATSSDLIVGGLYAMDNEDGTYGVCKVLALDEFAVHVRIYCNTFDEIPGDLDSSALSLGGLDDPEGFGIGHAPLAREGFLQEQPIYLMQEPVLETELEGYYYYLDAMNQ